MAVGSDMLERHMKILKSMSGKQVEAGWFDSARYPTSNGKPGIQVYKVASLLNSGGTIEHPGGTKYITDAIVDDRFVGARFVKNDFQGDHQLTGPHKIVIPPRPFMRLAWSNFLERRGAIQKRLANDLFSGKIGIDQVLGQIGLEMEADIARSIKNGNWAPNADSTVAKKGFNKPLIENSFMLGSLTSKVIT